MNINWCKFGLHDVEIMDDRELVIAKLEHYLRTGGFKRDGKGLNPVNWIKGPVTITDEKITKMTSRCVTEVCLKCGKVSKNYDVKDLELDLSVDIDLQVYAHWRKQQAQNLRDAAQVRDVYKA